MQQEAELLPAGPSTTEGALEILREASRELEAVEGELATAIPARYRSPDSQDALSAEELISLRHHVRYHLARACRIRGTCYPAESADRIALLTQAVEVIDQARAEIGRETPLAVRLQVERAIALRHLGERDQAGKTLEALSTDQLNAESLQAVAAEAARLELARGRPAAALERLEEPLDRLQRRSAEFDFAWLETLLALCRSASHADDQAEADLRRKEAVSCAHRIEQHHGAYWARRADLALVNSLGALPGSGNVEILVRTADELYRKGQLDDALASYERAADTAEQAGDSERGFLLRYKAGLIDQNRGRYLGAARRLRQLSLGAAGHPRAPATHLLAAWNFAQQARSDRDALETYAETLREHIEQWPGDPTSNQARIWLGRLHQAAGRWRAATEAFGGIPNHEEHAEEALASAAICWDKLLETTAGHAETDPEPLIEAAEYFELRIAGLLTDAPTEWTALDRQCAFQAARFRLRQRGDGFRRAEAILRAALDGPPPLGKADQDEALGLLVLALSGQPGKAAEATAVLSRIGGESDQLISLLKRLNAIAATRAAPQNELAPVRLALVERIASQGVRDGDQQRLLDRTRAAALLDSGRRPAAMTAFAELAEAFPDDLALQTAYAQLLLESGAGDQLAKGLDRWRQIASRSRPRSETWYRARYSVALALFRLGRHGQAAERIRYLQVAPPGLEGSEWKDDFLALLRRCNAEAGR
jgi:TolA-binding protein